MPIDLGSTEIKRIFLSDTNRISKVFLGTDLVYESPVYNISYYLVGTVSSDDRITIEDGERFNTTITLQNSSTHQFTSAILFMGGVDVTHLYLTRTSTKITIVIPCVTGHINIEARSAQATYSCTSITCNSSMTVGFDSDANLNVVVNPTGCTDAIYWEVSNTSALSVYESSGKYWVHAIKSGNYTVTLYCGDKSCTSSITIKEQVYQMSYIIGSGVTLSYRPSEAVAGTAFATRANNATTVTVKMGGVDITSTVLTYNDGYIYISISSITGDVEITAK